MKFPSPLILFLLSFIFLGCPYESNVELNTYEESIRIDKKLLDIWVTYHEDGSREEVLFSKAAASVFDVKHKQYSSNKKLEGIYQYRVYPTEINDYVIFNIEQQNGKYFFAKYGWTGKNTFYLQAVNKEYVDKNLKVDSVTTDNLRNFIGEHVNNEKLYDEKLEFYRRDSPEHERVKTFMRKSGF